jgi:hypothetical protein|tara:strand:+ start:1233 stop:1460 length:228 start_codon:yes stop_codon:yes gene_type:complete
MSNRHIQIDGYSELKRERYSSGIINTSTSEYKTYMAVQTAKKSEKVKMQTMCDEINSIKDEMSSIKSMIQQILEK